MKYTTSAAFRQALEERLRRHSIETGVPLVRIRKMVAFERFLSRLVTSQPNVWALKGGLALQFRLGDRARTTQDVDLLLRSPSNRHEIHQLLVKACLGEIGDWFTFEISRSSAETLRFPVQSLLDSRPFETFHVDVGIGDPITEPLEMLLPPPWLEFADIVSTPIPAYPVSQQIAEKVHACTRTYSFGKSSRVKDWVDILLLAQQGSLRAEPLRQALEATFDARGTHPLPDHIPGPPSTWDRPFRRMAEQTGLSSLTIDQAAVALERFLDPILQRKTTGTWNPERWEWE